MHMRFLSYSLWYETVHFGAIGLSLYFFLILIKPIVNDTMSQCSLRGNKNLFDWDKNPLD